MTLVSGLKGIGIYEMEGENHVSLNAIEAIIQPYFNPAFIIYEVGFVTNIPSVKYIGLWINDANVGYQKDWNLFQQKLPNETPTTQELTNAVRPNDDPLRQAARQNIIDKAQLWVNRIDGDYFASLNSWTANYLTPNSINAIQYLHPKYNPSSGGPGVNAATTTEWHSLFPPGTDTSWLTVATYGGYYPGKDPDGAWTLSGGDIGGTSYTEQNRFILVVKSSNHARTQIVIVHEVAHATKFFFKRQDFGPHLDHTDPNTGGLMDPTASQPQFTERELKILRGAIP